MHAYFFRLQQSTALYGEIPKPCLLQLQRRIHAPSPNQSWRHDQVEIIRFQTDFRHMIRFVYLLFKIYAHGYE